MTYRLLDFGGGRKLESLAGYVIDRPSPAADHARRAAGEAWSNADARFDRKAKRWTFRQPWPDELTIDCGGFVMPVRPTPAGHIGLFPEQWDNWRWLERGNGSAALNLFGYTGASTIALARSGYRVDHVDAAKPNVAAAGEAARRNSIAPNAVRCYVDDAAKFVARRRRRGAIYQAIVLDPPAYGHGPGGRAWRLERDLWSLLEDCLAVADPCGFRMLVTGHSPQVTESDVRDRLDLSAGTGRAPRIESERSKLVDQAGRPLDAGFSVRIIQQP